MSIQATLYELPTMTYQNEKIRVMISYLSIPACVLGAEAHRNETKLVPRSAVQYK